MTKTNISKLIKLLEPLYEKNSKKLLFHGWHHVIFVTKKATIFAAEIKADELMVKAAALTHDLNYIVNKNSYAVEGKNLRSELLCKAGFTDKEILRIEHVVLESSVETRGEQITLEGMALSDADTLFKTLPITPVLFASKYITENNIDIYKLAKKISSEQTPLLNQGIYFYTPYAKKKYLNWAKINLKLWDNMIEALEDEDVREVIEISKIQSF